MVAVGVTGFWSGCASGGSERATLLSGRACQTAPLDSVVTIGDLEEGDVVKFVNADGTEWWEIDFYNDDETLSIPEDFRPLAFHPDYFVLTLTYCGMSGDLAGVVVDERSDSIKHVDVARSGLAVQSWEEHIIESVAQVSLIDVQSLIVGDSPDSNATESVELEPNNLLRPIAIEGDWLRVETNQETQGWVRWRDENGMMNIHLYYFN